MPDAAALTWRKSSRSGAGNNCVEVASLADGRVAIRDSKNPDAGPLIVSAAGMNTWLTAIKTGSLER